MPVIKVNERPFKLPGLRLPTTNLLDKIILESVVDFMKSLKTALNAADGIESALDEEKRVVEFIHKPWVKAACIRIKLNSSNYHDIIIKYSAQTSKPISPADAQKDIEALFKWFVNTTLRVRYIGVKKTETFVYIADRITLEAERYLKEKFGNNILVLRLRRGENVLQNDNEIRERLHEFFRRIAKAITTFIGTRVENLIYKLKDSVKSLDKVAKQTKIFLDRAYTLYKTLVEKFKLDENKLESLVNDFYLSDVEVIR
ncbi:MAG: hypothetical protein QXK11_10790 [Pyrobaculum sp.]|uniref:hypothetical protein n=1 Tax=Pyrobaculum sp. TaxID=2004705 RepID=UPI003177F07E